MHKNRKNTHFTIFTQINEILEYVNGLNEVIGKIMEYVLAILMILIPYEVVRRYFFNSPTIWGMELASYIMCFCAALGGGRLYLRDEHVRVDIIYGKLNPKKQMIVRILTFPLIVLFLLGFTYASGKQAYFSIKMGENSGSLWEFPIYLLWLSIFMGSILILFQAIVTFLNELKKILENQ